MSIRIPKLLLATFFFVFGSGEIMKADELPAYHNNAETKYMRRPFNQVGSSCGPASRIGYMFTYELNAYRDVAANTAVNLYPPNFVYPYSYDKLSKEGFAQYVGIPNAVTYGGEVYSSLYGWAEARNVVDAAWMTGYDKWYEAMHNRIAGTSRIAGSTITEAGTLALKRYLYNHDGDPDFRGVGGIVGIGCGIAKAGVATIGKTDTNDNIGVTGKKYLKHWNIGGIDHAMSVVGWDDRIEFDLDNNGIYGEKSNYIEQNEKGAWIVVNSWGTSYGNGGYIYVPYALASPTSLEAKNEKEETIYKRNGGWSPEVYHVRKNYKIERTLKLGITYSKRSEISLTVGIAQDTTATTPEATVLVRNINYQGDTKSDGIDAEVPMLGRWADGKLHYEVMEFGYDLTDLSADFDKSKPLKYFFIVNTKATADGKGGIHYASIMDYIQNSKGIETPFLIKGDSVNIATGGQQTVISTIVGGNAYSSPINLQFSNGILSWEAPIATNFIPVKYYIYKDLNLVGETTSTSYSVGEETGVSYTVKAEYRENETTVLSSQSDKLDVKAGTNDVMTFNKTTFTVPNVFAQAKSKVTIEWWMKLPALSTNAQSIGPSSKSYLTCVRANGAFELRNSKGTFISKAGVVKTDIWQHYAVVIDRGTFKVYLDGESVLSGAIQETGIPVCTPFYFGSTNANFALNGTYDDIRIWNTARTQEEIKALKDKQLHNVDKYTDLAAYYKMNTVKVGNTLYLKDAVGLNDATILSSSSVTAGTDDAILAMSDVEAGISDKPEKGFVNEAIKFYDASSLQVKSWAWTINGKQYVVKNPVVFFSQTGIYNIDLTVMGANGSMATATRQIAVETPAFTADFYLSKDTISSGSRASFLTYNKTSQCRYKWTLDGADNINAVTSNASGQWDSPGTYIITCEVISQSGEVKTASHKLVVMESAPEAHFYISSNIILKGDTVTMVDRSKYGAKQMVWRFVDTRAISDAKKMYGFTLRGDSIDYVPTRAGVYDLYYNVSNSVGSSVLNRSRALTVVSSKSYNGLTFGSGNMNITATLPVNAITSVFTVDYWIKPTLLSATTMGLKADGFSITYDAKGIPSFTIGSNSAIKGSKSVITLNEWHHVAFVFRADKRVWIYRDGVKIDEVTIASLPSFKTLQIAGTGFMGEIDEFHVWKTALGTPQIQADCVRPTGNDARMVLYYQFNQTSGNVEDVTGNGVTGIRNNFGPDGDAWTASDGVFWIDKDDFSYTTIENDYLLALTEGFTKFDETEYSVDSYTVQNGDNKAVNVLDGKTNTYWQTVYGSSRYPFSLVIKREVADTICSIVLNESVNRFHQVGLVSVYSSKDGVNWRMIDSKIPVWFDNSKTSIKTGLNLSQPVTEPYVRVVFENNATGASGIFSLNNLYFYGKYDDNSPRKQIKDGRTWHFTIKDRVGEAKIYQAKPKLSGDIAFPDTLTYNEKNYVVSGIGIREGEHLDFGRGRIISFPQGLKYIEKSSFVTDSLWYIDASNIPIMAVNEGKVSRSEGSFAQLASHTLVYLPLSDTYTEDSEAENFVYVDVDNHDNNYSNHLKVYDGYDCENIYVFQARKADYSRVMKTEYCNAIFLPYRLTDLTGMRAYTIGGRISNGNMEFIRVTALDENTAYMIKPEAESTLPTQYCVNVPVTKSVSENMENGSVSDDGWHFVGTTSRMENPEASANRLYYYSISKKRFIKIPNSSETTKSAKYTLNAFRSALKAPIGMAMSAPSSINVFFTDETTDIKGLDNGKSEIEEKKMFDVQGRSVSKTKNGNVYIINGRKVVR